MKNVPTLLLLIVLIAIAHPAAAKAQHSLHYEPETVDLEGRLVIERKFGPPNYGENPKTDQKVKVPILVLRSPISVLPNDTDDHNSQPVNNAKKIQLAFITTQIAYKELIGKNVVVSGSLFHAHTAHHYTDVVLSVRSIKLSATPNTRAQSPALHRSQQDDLNKLLPTASLLLSCAEARYTRR